MREHDPRSRRWPPLAAIALAAVLGGLPGCKVGPDYKPPETPMPDAWRVSLTKGLSTGEADIRTWWKSLGDPVLDRLIERAAVNNLSVKAALSRIDEARAVRGIAGAPLLPQVSGVGSSEFYRNSEETALGPVYGGKDEQLHTLGFDANWEIDVFGGIRRSMESADASLQATVEDYRDLLVVLFAEVARNYIEARTTQARLKYALANVEAQKRSLQLAQDRFKAQLVPQLDVRQGELNLANTESLIPSLRASLRLAIHRIGVLLGEFPSALVDDLSPEKPYPALPAEVSLGLPADLLRRRPDIRRAERLLAAQNAQIGVAESDLYPKFFLGGALTLQAADLGNLFDAARSHAYSLGPSFRWNLFAGGRVRNAIRAEDARTREAFFAYESTVLSAVEEVESGLVSFAEEKDRMAALARSAEAASSSVDLVTTLYRNGLTDFQNVLDMQRSLFQQQDSLAQSEGQVIQDLIAIYKALGGGWAPEPEESGPEAAPEATDMTSAGEGGPAAAPAAAPPPPPPPPPPPAAPAGNP